MTQQSWTFKDTEFKEIWDRAAPLTMTSPERGYALYLAVRYAVENQILGTFVDCGVGRGGSALIILLTLIKMGARGRDLIVFDTFDGKTEPAQAGGAFGEDAITEHDVRATLLSSTYGPRRIRLVRGDVSETLPRTQTGPIVLLRLNTGMQTSYQAELKHLFPRVVRGGVVLIDDYGADAEARKAVDQYFDQHKGSGKMPLLQPIDDAGRMFIKTEPMGVSDIERYDYVPPGLADPQLQKFFPLEAVDPTKVRWRYLRHRAPHIWRVDQRANPRMQIGVLSTEEAVLLHNCAKPFAGHRALEIGCHFGWSTAQLIAAGLHLDVVDPALGNPDHCADVDSSLSQIGGGSYNLWAGFSPSIIPAVLSAGAEPWSFVFIDGNHDKPGPRLDAEIVSANCAPDAMVVLHDLVSPDVADGLRVFKEQGWNCRLYNTMQIMGVAWRGNVTPPEHVADPNVPGLFQSHLADLGI